MTDTTDLEVRDTANVEQQQPSHSGALVLRGDQTEWTPMQRAALGHLGIEDAPAGDQQVFLHLAQRTGLDPFARQIYMIPRKERGKNGQPETVRWTIQTGIDGFRLIAEKHPQYAGTLDPEWCGEDGKWRETWTDRQVPAMARVKVLRHDRAHPISLPVRFSEFAATFSNGDLQGQWKTKPAHMIGKVAEAAALRKAFPQDLSGMVTDDEMSREDSGRGEAPSRGNVIDGEAVTADELTGAAPHSAPVPTAAQNLMREIVQAGSERRWTPDQLTADFKQRTAGTLPADATEAELRAYLGWLIKQPPIDDPDAKPSKAMFAKLHAQLAELGVTEDRRHEDLSLLAGRTITSANDLSHNEVQQIIDRLGKVLAEDEPLKAMDALLAEAAENSATENTAGEAP